MVGGRQGEGRIEEGGSYFGAHRRPTKAGVALASCVKAI